MSIKSFLESSEILYNNQKYEEALCLVCIAIDACASKQYSIDNYKNNERYKLFLKENFNIICKYGFPDIQVSKIRIKIMNKNIKLKTDKNGYVSMEEIIYHVLRCGLVHECCIEETIEFTDSTIIGDWTDKFYIPKDIIWGFINSVKNYISKNDNNAG